jgi:hypothetical protein
LSLIVRDDNGRAAGGAVPGMVLCSVKPSVDPAVATARSFRADTKRGIGQTSGYVLYVIRFVAVAKSPLSASLLSTDTSAKTGLGSQMS